jgi:hypothetical protein
MDQERAVLVGAKELRRPEEQRAEDRLATLIRLGSIVRNSAPKGANDECRNVRTSSGSGS